jgi:hypothetical protein
MLAIALLAQIPVAVMADGAGCPPWRCVESRRQSWKQQIACADCCTPACGCSAAEHVLVLLLMLLLLLASKVFQQLWAWPQYICLEPCLERSLTAATSHYF